MKPLEGTNVIAAKSDGSAGCGGNCNCASSDSMEATDLTGAIQERYSKVAVRGASSGSADGCCGSGASDSSCCGSSATLYDQSQVDAITPEAAGASAGCGNPVGISDVKPGEVVVDLGSGGGIDCFLAAKVAGSSGHVYGVDMTNEMVKLARENAERLDAQNVTFLLGRIEAVPLPDSSADLVISNCVIALAPDKQQVFDEIMRVLKPGGRFVVADVVSTREVPDDVKQDMAEWVACIGGADLQSRYISRIANTGFENVETLADVAYSGDPDGDEWRSSLRSVTIRAFKPA